MCQVCDKVAQSAEELTAAACQTLYPICEEMLAGHGDPEQAGDNMSERDMHHSYARYQILLALFKLELAESERIKGDHICPEKIWAHWSSLFAKALGRDGEEDDN